MALRFSDIVEEARLSARALLDYGEHFFNPTVRLGVTGLSRAGKTVFITALVHGLTRGGRFPVFEPFATGRIARARLEPQPDDAVPRFDYENHVRTLIERPALAELDGRHQRIAAGDRLSAAQRRRPHADARYRRLSRRMAARSAAAQQELRAMVAPKASRCRAQQPRAQLAAPWHAHLATLNAEAPRGRTGRADRGAAVHRLSARLPRRTFRHEPAAARPLPDAGQPRGLAGADLCAARSAGGRHRAGGIAVGDDGAALRGLQGRGGAAVLPRSFRAARSPDRAGRCARGVQCRARSAARSRGGAGGNSRLLPDRPQHASQQPVPAADRPHPVRRDQGRSSAPFEPRPARSGAAADRRQGRRRAPNIPAPRSTSWRWPRCAPPARRRCSAAAKNCRRSSARRPPARSPMARRSTARPRSRPFRATCPPIPKQLFKGEGAFRGLSSAAAEKTDFRFLRFRPPQLESDGAGRPALPHIRLDRALQFLIGDRLQ